MEIKVVRQILEWNQDCSDELKDVFKKKGIFVINVMGSPGAGKTSLITKIIEMLGQRYNIAVIEGDIAGKIDAEKIGKMGVPVVQLNTDGACHIEAMSIKNIIPDFNLDDIDVIIIENIGNLVCPAEFNIGEDIRVALLSIPEGDDKVVKYPLMFATSHCIVLNKFDMLDYFDFDHARVNADIAEMNPGASIFPVSSSKGSGILAFIQWLEGRITEKLNKTKI